MKEPIVPPAARREISRVSRLQTVIWSTREGVRCVVARYDETRYQLRLLRAEGTVKADLFASLADANHEAYRWRAELNEQRSSNWPDVMAWESREDSRDGEYVASSCASDKAALASRRRRHGRSGYRVR